jgi:hypothetical protein
LRVWAAGCRDVDAILADVGPRALVVNTLTLFD